MQFEDACAFLARDHARFVPGPRPGRKSLQKLQSLDLTHCCTLLSEREGGPDIRSIADKIGCQWIWLPIAGGHRDTLAVLDIEATVCDFVDQIGQAPVPNVYIHCSAGIHRTGFFIYLLLRLSGRGPSQARAVLCELRRVTADQVGDERLDLADTMIASLPRRPR